MVFQRIIANYVPSKRVPSEIKFIQLHHLSPVLEVLDEIIYRFHRCYILNIVVLGSAAAAHADQVDDDEFEMLDEAFEHLIEKRTRPSISMNQHKRRLTRKFCPVTQDNRPDIHRPTLKGPDPDIKLVNLFYRQARAEEHLHFSVLDRPLIQEVLGCGIVIYGIAHD